VARPSGQDQQSGVCYCDIPFRLEWLNRVSVWGALSAEAIRRDDAPKLLPHVSRWVLSALRPPDIGDGRSPAWEVKLP